MANKDISHMLERSSLLGRTTVLILSGYLVGTSSSHFVLEGLKNYTLLAGLCGVIGYFGCEFVSRRRDERALKAAYQQVGQKLERFKVARTS